MEKLPAFVIQSEAKNLFLLLLAHHYEPEYGSPVRPMFAEAELLHHIDVIDARMNTMQRIQSETKAGGFSDKVWGLDGIQVYHRPDDAR